MRDFTELREAANDGRPNLCWIVDVLAALDELDALRAKVKPSKEKELPPGFLEAWLAYPERPGKSRAATLAAWNARIKAGASPAEMIFGVRRYAAYCIAERTEAHFIKQPATFFGPGEHFASDWTIKRETGGMAQLGKAGQSTARAAQDWMGES